ncbi:hypothetical protein SUGI_0937870 [Cryptomeria japonica]|nr:hypothetical protein SUGI_0937870 [Cryptomeria japonica]
MAFRIPSAFVWLNMNLLIILLLKMADHYTPVLAATGKIEDALQEPTVPLLNYLKVSKFSEGYANLWGGQHQNVSEDGSGFKSKEAYMYGFFNAAVKLQAGYTAWIITSFYLSNNQVYQGWHDEIDMEFLGTIPGEPYKLQTNDFHSYSFLWTPSQILFLVDGIPIRRFPKTESLGVIYPSKPMSVYATIWDASSWATDGGRYKANYSYEPFLSTFSNFQTIGCNDKDNYCSKVLIDNCLVSPYLNKKQIVDLKYVRKNYPKGTMPECSAQEGQLKELNILQNQQKIGGF